MADYTDEQLAAIRRAFASGVTRVRHGDSETSYRSLEEMERILKTVEADRSGAPKRRVGYTRQTSKGL